MELAEIFILLMVLAAGGFLLCGFPVAFTLGGTALIFGGLGVVSGVLELRDLMLYPDRIFGTMTNSVLMAVPLFVFMGVMLERSKVAEELLESMSYLMRKVRGGLGISVTIVGALLAASTGIVGATVVTMGLISLPTMLRRGYSPSLAAGSIAAAGTLGQIIPPSIVLILLGDVLSTAYLNVRPQLGDAATHTAISVGDLFAGALLPGLALVVMYILYQLGVAIFRPDDAPPYDHTRDDEERGNPPSVLQSFVPAFSLIVAVLGSILGGIATPTEAASVGAVGSLFLAAIKTGDGPKWPIYMGLYSIIILLFLNSFFDLRINLTVIPLVNQIAIGVALASCGFVALAIVAGIINAIRSGILPSVVQSTAQTTSMVFIILIGASLFSLVLLGYGSDDIVRDLLSNLAGGTVTALIVVMLVMFALGFFLDFIEITFVVVPIVAPALFLMGVDPIWLGVMMALNLQTSFLTPPFGFALFYLRGVAPASISTGQIYRGAIPFIIIQVLALAAIALFPALATWLPDVIFN
jgi:TRAP-type mannitol/chloroaromatic compound transport system permease large subunit